MVLGAQSIEVTVIHNDTLDRIFRRLKLDLADLASLRSLPGLKSGTGSTCAPAKPCISYTATARCSASSAS